jgi:hypothetical protein
MRKAAALSINGPLPAEMPQEVVVRITLRDPSTGAENSMLCTTTSDRVSTDAITVDIDNALDVTAALCER